MRLTTLVVTAVLLSACDTTTDGVFREETVVTAVLSAGRALPAVSLTRTLPFGSFWQPIPVDGAAVTVSLLDAAGAPEEVYSYVQGDAVEYVPVDTPAVLGGRRYRLEVVVPGQEAPITAETTVPTSFSIVEAPPDSVTYQAGPGPSMRISPSVVPGRQAVYVFTVRALDPMEFQRLPDESTPETDDSLWVPIPGTGFPPTPFIAELISERDVDPDAFWTGNSPLLNEGNYTPNPDGTLTIQLPWAAVNYFGPTELTITAVDDALLRFLESQAIQTVPTTISPGEIPNVDTNVVNGHGVFGAVAQQEVSLFVRPAP
jgi:hypothetical protein